MSEKQDIRNQALRDALESVNISAVALDEGDFSQGFIVSWEAVQKVRKALAPVLMIGGRAMNAEQCAEALAMQDLAENGEPS